MEYRELEVTVLSAQDLKNVRLTGGAMSHYAEVWIYSSKKVQTGVDTGGGTHPSWDCVLKLACEDNLFRSGGVISVAVYNRGSLSNKLIGTVTVPLWDLSAQCKAADEAQGGSSAMSTAMSYQFEEPALDITTMLSEAELLKKTAKKSELRRKRLVRKKKLRKKGRRSPSKTAKLKNF